MSVRADSGFTKCDRVESIDSCQVKLGVFDKKSSDFGHRERMRSSSWNAPATECCASRMRYARKHILTRIFVSFVYEAELRARCRLLTAARSCGTGDRNPAVPRKARPAPGSGFHVITFGAPRRTSCKPCESKKLLRTINVPTKYATNVGFGSGGADALYITGVFDQCKPPFPETVYRWTP